MIENLELCQSFQKLRTISSTTISTHLRDLLKDESRNSSLRKEIISKINPLGMLWCDFSRSKIDKNGLEHLMQFAKDRKLFESIESMFKGMKINKTENRQVLHTALRAGSRSDCKFPDFFFADGIDVLPEVQNVLERIQIFSEKIRSGNALGATGKILTNVICIGIGGSYLGPEFLVKALHTQNAKERKGRGLRFLSNVDPVDAVQAIEGWNPDNTLIVVVSKTFTTAETLLNAGLMKNWIVQSLGADAVKNHIVAVTTNVEAAGVFGILPENCFPFWDWVGGRYSVCSAVGCLPLAIHFGMPVVNDFLAGCREMDSHFATAPIESNLPVLAGLLSFWNCTVLKYNCVAILPYSQSLDRFPAFIQQLTMESNGKSVDIEGRTFKDVCTGQIFFGEPGTNGQHSFYQLLHQGTQIVPAEFIGVCCSPAGMIHNNINGHDELMAHYFSQQDALANGKTVEECRSDNVPCDLLNHKEFKGDRPSIGILLKESNAFSLGMLLALYEHRTAVEGFLWGLNSFDQWGVELGKVLAKKLKTELVSIREGKQSAISNSYNSSTKAAVATYLKNTN